MSIKILFLLSFISAHCLRSMDENHLTVYAVPGQNGCGSEPNYVRGLLSLEEQDCVVQVGTPSWFPDFGQRNCLKYLQDVVENSKAGGIIHATSQGTATALNYVAHHDNEKRIKALILEAVMLSGNNAIHHTVGGPLMNLSAITRLPGSYYWLPYLAKLSFPAYWPSGKQPIQAISHIPSDMPIIIAHSENDPQLAYSDACALYYGLRANGNNNVYFVTKPGAYHINILNTYLDKEYIIESFLAKHNFMGRSSTNVAEDKFTYLNSQQPDYMQYKKIYDDLLAKEVNHRRIFYSSALAGAGVVAAALWTLAPKNK